SAGRPALRVLPAPAREILRLAGQPAEGAVLVGRRQAGLARDGLHQNLQRCVRPRQGAGDLDRLGEIAVAYDRDVADEGPPDLAIVLEVESPDRVGGAGARRRQRGAGGAEDPRFLLGQLERVRFDLRVEVLVVAVLGIESWHALGQRLAALALEDQHRLRARLLRDGEVPEVRARFALDS